MNPVFLTAFRRTVGGACKNHLHKNFQHQSYVSYNSFSTIPVKFAYESSISLRTLYPTSSLQLTTPTKRPESTAGKFSGYIPIGKVEVTYSRSSGPGGQNVDKVNTKVDLRFNIDTVDWLEKETVNKLKEKCKTRITKEGFFIIRSDKTRSQQLNLADALEKLRTIIRNAEDEIANPVPSPETEEIIRKRKDKANRIRLAEKRTRSVKKADRGSPVIDF